MKPIFFGAILGSFIDVIRWDGSVEKSSYSINEFLVSSDLVMLCKIVLMFCLCFIEINWKSKILYKDNIIMQLNAEKVHITVYESDVIFCHISIYNL